MPLNCFVCLFLILLKLKHVKYGWRNNIIHGGSSLLYTLSSTKTAFVTQELLSASLQENNWEWLPLSLSLQYNIHFAALDGQRDMCASRATFQSIIGAFSRQDFAKRSKHRTRRHDTHNTLVISQSRVAKWQMSTHICRAHHRASGKKGEKRNESKTSSSLSAGAAYKYCTHKKLCIM